MLERLRPGMDRLVGLCSVVLACLSSGFASVYFERVLKNPSPSPSSPASTSSPYTPFLSRRLTELRDANSATIKRSLWIRNVQLSVFGLVIGMGIVSFEGNKERLVTWGQEWGLWYWDLVSASSEHRMAGLATLEDDSVLPREGKAFWSDHRALPFRNGSGRSLFESFFVGFTPIVYLVVALQILGGLLNALVIAHADNIAKGFSTSVSILLSTLASVVLFGEKVSLGSAIGAVGVLGATWLYNQPQGRLPRKVWGVRVGSRPASSGNGGHWSEKAANGHAAEDGGRSSAEGSEASHRMDIR